MKILIELDETPDVGVHIQGIIRPTQTQAYAMRALALLVAEYREDLLNSRLVK